MALISTLSAISRQLSEKTLLIKGRLKGGDVK